MSEPRISSLPSSARSREQRLNKFHPNNHSTSRRLESFFCPICIQGYGNLPLPFLSDRVPGFSLCLFPDPSDVSKRRSGNEPKIHSVDDEMPVYLRILGFAPIVWLSEFYPDIVLSLASERPAVF